MALTCKLVLEANYILNVMLKLLTKNANSYHILPSALLFFGHSLLALPFNLFSSVISCCISSLSSTILVTELLSYKTCFKGSNQSNIMLPFQNFPQVEAYWLLESQQSVF